MADETSPNAKKSRWKNLYPKFIETDVRVIAASNDIPEDAVTQGKLREDLLYRRKSFRSICRRYASGAGISSC